MKPSFCVAKCDCHVVSAPHLRGALEDFAEAGHALNNAQINQLHNARK